MSALEKLADKIPYADGGFRRRFSAGALIVLPSLVFLFIDNFESFKKLDIEFKDLITSPGIFICVLLLVYSLGNIVEVIGDVFIARIAGGIAWAVSYPRRKTARIKGKFRKQAAIVVLYYFVFPFLVYYEMIKGMGGTCSYQWDSISTDLSRDARKYYRQLPNIVQSGIAAPFGNNADSSWRFLLVSASDDQRKWLTKIESRNRELLTTLSAIVLVFMIFAPIGLERFERQRFSLFEHSNILQAENHSPSANAEVKVQKAPLITNPGTILIVVQISAFGLAIIFISYFRMLKKSLITVLESLATEKA